MKIKLKKGFFLYILMCVLLVLCLLALGCGEKPDDTGGEENPPLEPEKYTVTFNIDLDGVTVTNDAPLVQTVEEGDSVTVPELYRNYFAYEWDKPVVTENIAADAEYTAVWRVVGYAMPVIKIKTDDGKEITSKENYSPSTVTVSDAVYPEHDLSARAGVRGRGNSTWTLDKKPYRVKFDSKTSVLGRDKEKDWTLIACHADKTLMRNYIAFEFARELTGLPYTPFCAFVEVYFNDRYDGVYMLSDQIEPGSQRVPIEKDIGEDQYDYFIELDYRLRTDTTVTEGWDWFYSGTYRMPFAIKIPKTDNENFTKAHADAITRDVTSIESKIKNGIYSNIEKVLDIDSVIDYFLVQELFKNPDVGYSSTYSYKKWGEKLVMSPLWDFDLCGGNGLESDHEPYATDIYAEKYHPWFQNLMKIKDFKTKYVRRWNELYVDAIPDLLNSITDTDELISDYADKNFTRWNVLNESIFPNNSNIDKIKTFTGQVKYFHDFISARANWLNDHYN